MIETKEEIYEVREVSIKNPFRLYIDNEWIDSYETEPEALNALSKWIANNGLESFAEGLEYVFDEAFVCKIVKTERVVKKIEEQQQKK